ncbi:DUF6967 family protein [Rhodoferax sp.]|uniref:DUF6967 family protein n=1 Tax=Rhodoferax sp. TaxID=50421 RepID=UPI00284442B9|nr:hypothetical protein [Rhodoferax sp.]MDR3370513.1 hypothetical protein [Rhodoferax sp.]
MFSVIPLDKFVSPLGGQVIELQQLDYDAGGMSLLRTRIRENSRFTVFEVDPLIARQWGEALLRWAQAQPETQATTSAPTPTPTLP